MTDSGKASHDIGKGKSTAVRRPHGAGHPVPIWRFIVYVSDRFVFDGCQQRAASLTFTSLLAMVPLLAVSFAIFAAFPAYGRLKGEVQSYIFENFVPQVGTVIQEYLETFTQQTGGLTAVGILFLVFTAVMLMVSISNTFNAIWRARRRRNIVARMLVFWAMITLAPMVFGASLSISSYLFAFAKASGVETYTGSLNNLAFLLPFTLQAFGFTALFLIMPNYPVRRTDALIGGLTASMLFEFLKKGFGLYITYFPTYQTIYGALATIPIFLVWVYLSWIIVLLAAEITASLPEWRGGSRKLKTTGLAPVDRLVSSLAVLNALRQATIGGGGLSEARLLREANLGPDGLADVEQRLEDHNYIARGEKGHWLLVRDLDHVTLYDLYEHLGLGVESGTPIRQARKAWAQRFGKTKFELTAAMREKMSIPLGELLTPDANETVANDVEQAALDQSEEEFDRDKGRGRARILALLGLGAVSAGS